MLEYNGVDARDIGYDSIVEKKFVDGDASIAEKLVVKRWFRGVISAREADDIIVAHWLNVANVVDAAMSVTR